MVKSVVECSPDLTWALVAKNNVFIRRSRSATRQKCFRSFSAEAANVTSEHKFKFSGLANDVAVGVNAFKYPKDYSKKQNATAVAVIVGGKTTKVAGIFQQQAKAVADAVAASRPDLTVAALAKLSAVQRGLRVAAAAAKAQ